MGIDEKITNVEVDTITENSVPLYSDGDIVIIEDVAELTESNPNAYELNLVILGFCKSGRMQMMLNGVECSVAKDDIIILPPRSLVENIMISPDFKCIMVGLNYNALKNNMQTSHFMWNLRMYLTQNPVTHLSTRASHIGALYGELLKEKLEERERPYFKEVMLSLFQCLFYELISLIHPMLETKPMSGNVTQGDLLCKRFFELLNATEGKERSVSKFADQLCVTPKYLSTTCKATTGRTALEWIHEAAVETIKRKLKFTEKSVKEIADEMNFPNLSFFGKFVRTHIGMSPTEYRKQLYESKGVE